MSLKYIHPCDVDTMRSCKNCCLAFMFPPSGRSYKGFKPMSPGVLVHAVYNGSGESLDDNARLGATS